MLLNASCMFCGTFNLLTVSFSDSGAEYEVKLVAYNGNGESDCSKRLVSLADEGASNPAAGEYDHRQEQFSTSCFTTSGNLE